MRPNLESVVSSYIFRLQMFRDRSVSQSVILKRIIFSLHIYEQLSGTLMKVAVYGTTLLHSRLHGWVRLYAFGEKTTPKKDIGASQVASIERPRIAFICCTVSAFRILKGARKPRGCRAPLHISRDVLLPVEGQAERQRDIIQGITRA